MTRGADDAALGDHIVDGHVMNLGVDIVNELKVVGHTDFYGAGVMKQTVIISFAASYAVAAAIATAGTTTMSMLAMSVVSSPSGSSMLKAPR